MPQSGSTPLHSATGTNRFDVVRFLLEKGADTSIKDDDEKTPFELAKSDGNAECIELLNPKKKGGGGCCVVS